MSDLKFITISKWCFWIFLIYMNWYKEVWTDNRIILFGSVIIMTIMIILENGGNFLCQAPKILLVFILFGIYALLSGVFVATDSKAIISSIITYFEYIVVLYDCYIISFNEGDCRWMLCPLFCVGVLCSFQALFFGCYITNGGAKALTLSVHNNPNTLAATCLYGIFALIALDEQVMKGYLFRFFLIVVLMYTIVLTGSRKILISALIFVAFWAVIMLRKAFESLNTIKSWIVIYSFLASIIIFQWYFTKYYSGSDQFIRLFNLLSNSDGVNSKRFELYKEAFRIWKTSPIFGVGFNQFSLHSIYGVGYYSHSTYAEVLSCEGLIGCCILFIPIAVMYLKMIYTVLHNPHNYNYIMCILAFSVEVFLGIGQVWVYGYVHMLMLLLVTLLFERATNKELTSSM